MKGAKSEHWVKGTFGESCSCHCEVFAPVKITAPSHPVRFISALDQTKKKSTQLLSGLFSYCCLKACYCVLYYCAAWTSLLLCLAAWSCRVSVADGSEQEIPAYCSILNAHLWQCARTQRCIPVSGLMSSLLAYGAAAQYSIDKSCIQLQSARIPLHHPLPPRFLTPPLALALTPTNPRKPTPLYAPPPISPRLPFPHLLLRLLGREEAGDQWGKCMAVELRGGCEPHTTAASQARRPGCWWWWGHPGRGAPLGATMAVTMTLEEEFPLPPHPSPATTDTHTHTNLPTRSS